MSYRPCAVVPVYNHSERLPGIVERLRNAGLHCLLVNDGSDALHTQRIRSLSLKNNAVTVIEHPRNRGKGAAVKTGLRAAREGGYSHALQVDADGQHDLAHVEAFLAMARTYPDHLICGRPRFDDSIPRGRYYGRYLTHVWVWINTGSFSIPDAMCGFRVYPIAAITPLLTENTLGDRMDFDIEILVRAYWWKIPMKWLPVRVHYPRNNRSHFRPWEDNWRISRMHARLFFHRLFSSAWQRRN